MANDNNELDRFFNLLQEQGRVLQTQGQTLATIAQSQKDTHERLFGAGGQPGIVQYLAKKDEELDKRDDEINKSVQELGTALAGVKSDRRADKAYVVGFATVCSLIVKAGLGKLGWHF